MNPEKDDIAERLRAWEALVSSGYEVPGASPVMLAAADELDRLRAGGCARDQKTTQYCAEAATLANELERVKVALANATSERDNANAREYEALKLITNVAWWIANGHSETATKHIEAFHIERRERVKATALANGEA